jgi:hypothetical protein
VAGGRGCSLPWNDSFIGFTDEEPGEIGSHFYARHMTKEQVAADPVRWWAWTHLAWLRLKSGPAARTRCCTGALAYSANQMNAPSEVRRRFNDGESRVLGVTSIAYREGKHLEAALLGADNIQIAVRVHLDVVLSIFFPNVASARPRNR